MKTDNKTMRTSRRSFIEVGVALAGFVGLGVARTACAAETINVIRWGADSLKGNRKIFVDPITAETGIAVRLTNNADRTN